jgi:hypothetical protein
MFADQVKKYGFMYLKAVAVTAPATIAIAANNVKDAFKEGRNVLPELGLGIADVASCGGVSVGRGIKAVLAARKAIAVVPAKPAVASAPAAPAAQPDNAQRLTAPDAKKVEDKPNDKLVDPAQDQK